MNAVASPAQQWVPLPEAAHRLQLSWDAVVRLVKRGALEGKRSAGRRWFVRADSIARLSGWRRVV